MSWLPRILLAFLVAYLTTFLIIRWRFGGYSTNFTPQGGISSSGPITSFTLQGAATRRTLVQTAYRLYYPLGHLDQAITGRGYVMVNAEGPFALPASSLAPRGVK